VGYALKVLMQNDGDFVDLILLYLRFGTAIGSWIASPLKMGPIGCPEKSVINDQFTLRNI
jgi:hypothetical protein